MKIDSRWHSQWRRWRKTRTYKKLSSLAKKIRNDPKFMIEKQELERKFPPRNDKIFRKFRKETLSYPKEWNDFCYRWKIDISSFRKGEVKVNRPVLIKGQILSNGKFKLYMEIDESRSPLSITGQEYRDFEPLFLAAKDDLIGQTLSRAGRKKDKAIIKRNINIKKQFEHLRKNMGSQKAIRGLACKYYRGERTVNNIVYNS
jgi:hypothetical protein